MTRRIIALLMILGIVLGAQALFAQCENQTGTAKFLCMGKSVVPGAIGAQLPTGTPQIKEGLTTSFADALRNNTAPPTAYSDGFESLFALERTGEGGIVLKPGAYEAYVTCFSLDPTDHNAVIRTLGFLPAPEKGERAKLIQEILKKSELQPDVNSWEVQNLLWAVVANGQLHLMPADLQQAAQSLLGSDAGQLEGASNATSSELQKKGLDIIGKQVNRNPNINIRVNQAQATIANLDAKSGGMVSAGIGLLGSLRKGQASPGAGLPRGTWAQMPEGFYVRYLTEEKGVRLQVLVPETAASKVFDPTQYIAVYSGTPAQRLGISLRPVQ